MKTQEFPDNEKLIKQFGAHPVSKLSSAPDFYTFKTGILASHRDFDKFYAALKKGERCGILSGFNASGTLHLGHKAVFDTNLFFQKKYNLPVFIPISDDESYITGKVKTQEEALENSKKLAKQLLAYGFNPKKTFFIIDQIYTSIYNLAVKLSKKVTLSEVKSVYGYKNEDNPGMYFYPAIQAAHIVFPQEFKKIKNVLVPIGPDEDAHFRIARDMAARSGYHKPATIHSGFLPGIDGKKMSKSKNNAIFLDDSEMEIKKKINKSFSGGQKSIDEHRKKGGNPDVDIAFIFLKNLFLSPEKSKKLAQQYKSGKLLTSELKALFAKEVIAFTRQFQSNLKKVTDKDLEDTILKN
jgi:tryptophanyl-tRNA synthetase